MVGEIKVNYNLECEKILNSLDLNNKKTLLLYACCAPCSSAVLERISKYFKISDKLLKQILANLTMVRNISAHSDRLFCYRNKYYISFKNIDKN